MRPYLVDLLTRMATREFVASSSQSTSWKALREAETLTDLSMVDELAQYLPTESAAERRDRAYFVIGKIGLNTGDTRCVHILVERLGAERDTSILASMLDRISDLTKPRELDLSPVLKLLEHKRHQVRSSAVRALKASNNPQVEERLLELAARSTDEYILTNINATLGSIGSRLSIPYLSGVCDHRKTDVACSALHALACIGGQELLPQFIGRLRDRRRDVKWAALIAIEEHGDERAIEEVLKRVKYILTHPPKIEGHPSELVTGLTFLHRFRHSDTRITRLIETTLPRRLKYFFESERLQIAELIGED